MQMQERQAELEGFKRDAQYYEAHRQDLLGKYPEQWVAIFNEEVVGTAPDFDQLLDNLEAKHMPVGKVFVEHLTSKDELLILPA